MVQRRVIVGFDPGPVGANALWWAVNFADQLPATLFVVLRRPRSWVVPPRPRPPDAGLVLDRARTAVADALLLAVGEAPPSLDIRVAAVSGPVPAAVARFADRGDDVVLLVGPRRHWRGPTEPLVVTDAVSPPTRESLVHGGRQHGQPSRFLSR